MARPGTTLTRTTSRPPRSARTGTGPWFIAGTTGSVDTDAGGVRKPMHNLTEYATRFGSRAAHTDPSMYDAAEQYFKERGAELFASRSADATDAALTTALAAFPRDLGPGQISVPGRTAATQQLALLVHAEANDRIAILDGPDSANVATLTAAASIAGASINQERYGGMFAGAWPIIPIGGGATRTIAPSSSVAALMARRDAEGWSQNQPAAGELGELDWAIDVSRSFSEIDRTTLNVNGVNLLRGMYGGVRVYGYRTLSDPALDPEWNNLANARLFMAIQAKADEVMERFVFRQLDGQGRVITEFGGALTGVLLPFWQKGSLFGETPDAAFRVDVGPNVNTPTTLANRELHANIALHASEFAEEVILELVKVRNTEAI